MDEILNLIESVSEGFPSYSHTDLPQQVQWNESVATHSLDSSGVVDHFLTGVPQKEKDTFFALFLALHPQSQNNCTQRLMAQSGHTVLVGCLGFNGPFRTYFSL